MGEETTQFASRFGLAVDLLGRFAGDETFAKLRKRHGRELVGLVREALDAVAAVHETRTEAVKNWSERGAAVLARVAAVRAALERGGADAEARRAAAALLEELGRAEAGR